MARSIASYDAPDRRLVPSEVGVDAFTRAGRYVGQYYRQAASDVAQGGVLNSQLIRERGWPFDIMRLEQAGAKARGGGGGGGVRVGGTSDPFGLQRTYGGFGGDSGYRANVADGLYGGGSRYSRLSQARQVSSGAASVSGVAARLGIPGSQFDPTNQDPNSYNPETGLPWNPDAALDVHRQQIIDAKMEQSFEQQQRAKEQALDDAAVIAAGQTAQWWQQNTGNPAYEIPGWAGYGKTGAEIDQMNQAAPQSQTIPVDNTPPAGSATSTVTPQPDDAATPAETGYTSFFNGM